MELKPFVTLGRKYLAIKNETAYLAAGVGPVAAAFGLTHFLEDYRPDSIVVIGTGGVIDVDNFKIGDVVVALLQNEYATLKKFYRERDRIRLQPANTTMQPIYARDPLIQGVVKAVIRKFQTI